MIVKKSFTKTLFFKKFKNWYLCRLWLKGTSNKLNKADDGFRKKFLW